MRAVFLYPMADKLGELVSFKIEYDNPIVLENLHYIHDYNYCNRV